MHSVLGCDGGCRRGLARLGLDEIGHHRSVLREQVCRGRSADLGRGHGPHAIEEGVDVARVVVERGVMGDLVGALVVAGEGGA